MMVFFLMLVLTSLNILALDAIWDLSGTYLSIMSAYLGLFLLGCSLISCGIFISSLTESQIVAGVGTIGVFVFFWFLTWNEMMASEEIIKVLIRFSLFDRIGGFFRGVIDTKDVAFFVLFTLFFLFMALRALEARSWRGHK